MNNPNFEKISSKLSNVKNKPTTIEQTDDKSLNEAIEDVYSYPEEAIGNLYRLDRNEFSLLIIIIIIIIINRIKKLLIYPD